jgi:hypothetical protein
VALAIVPTRTVAADPASAGGCAGRDDSRTQWDSIASGEFRRNCVTNCCNHVFTDARSLRQGSPSATVFGEARSLERLVPLRAELTPGRDQRSRDRNRGSDCRIVTTIPMHPLLHCTHHRRLIVARTAAGGVGTSGTAVVPAGRYATRWPGGRHEQWQQWLRFRLADHRFRLRRFRVGAAPGGEGLHGRHAGGGTPLP